MTDVCTPAPIFIESITEHMQVQEDKLLVAADGADEAPRYLIYSNLRVRGVYARCEEKAARKDLVNG
jgi:hypothetical protein